MVEDKSEKFDILIEKIKKLSEEEGFNYNDVITYIGSGNFTNELSDAVRKIESALNDGKGGIGYSLPVLTSAFHSILFSWQFHSVLQSLEKENRNKKEEIIQTQTSRMSPEELYKIKKKIM